MPGVIFHRPGGSPTGRRGCARHRRMTWGRAVPGPAHTDPPAHCHGSTLSADRLGASQIPSRHHPGPRPSHFLLGSWGRARRLRLPQGGKCNFSQEATLHTTAVAPSKLHHLGAGLRGRRSAPWGDRVPVAWRDRQGPVGPGRDGDQAQRRRVEESGYSEAHGEGKPQIGLAAGRGVAHCTAHAARTQAASGCRSYVSSSDLVPRTGERVPRGRPRPYMSARTPA